MSSDQQSGASSYRWVVLGVGLLAMTAGAAYAQGLAAISPALREHYGIGLGTVGLLLGAVSLGLVPALLPWGLAADRWGERPVMATGLLAAAGCQVALSSQRGLGAVIALLVAGGAGSAAVNAASGRAVMQWFPSRGRGTAMAIRQTSSPLGAGLAALALPRIVGGYGVPAVYLGLAALCGVSAVAVLCLMRRAPTTGIAPAASTVADATSERPARPLADRLRRDHLRMRRGRAPGPGPARDGHRLRRGRRHRRGVLERAGKHRRRRDRRRGPDRRRDRAAEHRRLPVRRGNAPLVAALVQATSWSAGFAVPTGAALLACVLLARLRRATGPDAVRRQPLPTAAR